MMFTGVPNLAWILGYFRASWTLRVDLVADFVCKLLNSMEAKQQRSVTVELRPHERDGERLPWIAPDNFNPGYLMRDIDRMPRRAAGYEWQHTQDYWREKDEFPRLMWRMMFFIMGERGMARFRHAAPSC